jgi:predicted metal-dependent hydrolase
MRNYTLIRQARKTMGLYIVDGAPVVRAPLRTPKAEIDKFVASKEKWIAKKLAEARERETQKQNFALEYGSLLLWRGAEHPILGDSGDGTMWMDEQGFHFPPGMDGAQLKYNVVRLYKLCAKEHLAPRVRHFAAVMGVNPDAVKVTGAKTRWGSCSKRKRGKGGAPACNLNFSWRLCLADDDVIDAVVVHELAHITEMNHGKAFYKIVRSVLPDYDARNARLKPLTRKLGREDWEV